MYLPTGILTPWMIFPLLWLSPGVLLEAILETAPRHLEARVHIKRFLM